MGRKLAMEDDDEPAIMRLWSAKILILNFCGSFHVDSSFDVPTLKLILIPTVHNDVSRICNQFSSQDVGHLKGRLEHGCMVFLVVP